MYGEGTGPDEGSRDKENFTREKLEDIGYDPSTFDTNPSTIPSEELTNSIDRHMSDMELENRLEEERTEQRQEVLNRADSEIRLKDPYSNDRHLYPLLEIVKKHILDRDFENHKKAGLMRAVSDRFHSYEDLELLAEAVEQDYLRDEIIKATSEAKEYRNEANAYYDRYDDNSNAATMTRAEALIERATEKEKARDKLLLTKQKISRLILDVFEARRED